MNRRIIKSTLPSTFKLFKSALLVFGLSACVSISATTTDQQVVADLAISNVTVIDAVNGSRRNMSVLLKDDIILNVVAGVSDTQAKNTIDGTGKYLIPGLWDAHVHLTFDDKISSSMFRLFIANGITSVRDTGGQLDLVMAKRDQSRKQLAPSVYVAGPLLDGEPTVYAGKSPGFPEIGVTISTVEQAEAEVDRLADAGVDLLKAYEMLSPEVFRAVLKRAKYHGLPVTGHVPLSMTAEQAASAGLNSMEHLRNLQMDCSSQQQALFTQRQAMLLNNENKFGSTLRSDIHAAQHFTAVDSYAPERCEQLLKQLAKYNTWQVPTMTLNMLFKKPYYGEPEWQKTYQYLPAEVAKNWLERSTSVAKRLTAPSARYDQRLQVSNWQIQMLQQIIDADIPIMAGTDTPILYLTPGFSLHLELETLVMSGMTPMQAIESATLAPAKYFSLESKQGSVSPGMLADLVLLNADPLSEIKNTKKISAVIKGGKLIDRAALDSLLKPN